MVHVADRYDVSGNLPVLATVALRPGQPPLTNGLNPLQTFNLPDKRYWLRDDYVSSLTPAAMCWGTSPSGGNAALNVPCEPDTSLAKTLLAEAHVDLDEYVSRTTPLIPFISSYSTPYSNRYLQTAASLPADGRSTPEYWTVQLLAAFEARNTDDNDPEHRTRGTSTVDLDPNHGPGQAARAILGVASASLGGLKNRSAVFLETLRDLYEHPGVFGGRLAGDFIARDTAHELMHQFRLKDEDFGLMCRRNGHNVTLTSTGGALSDAELSVMRDQTMPRIPSDTDPPPPGPCP